MTTPEERPGERATDPLALLFDIRAFTGSLFLIFGIIINENKRTLINHSWILI